MNDAGCYYCNDWERGYDKVGMWLEWGNKVCIENVGGETSCITPLGIPRRWENNINIDFDISDDEPQYYLTE